MYYLLVSDEDFLSVKILVNVSIKNFLENLEIETTLQSGFDRNVTTLKSRYSDLDPEGGGWLPCQRGGYVTRYPSRLGVADFDIIYGVRNRTPMFLHIKIQRRRTLLVV